MQIFIKSECLQTLYTVKLLRICCILITYIIGIIILYLIV